MHWLAILALLAFPAVAAAADVLQEARVRIEMTDAVTCSVTASIAVSLETGGVIDQRLQRLEGAQIDLLGLSGGDPAAARPIGLTEAFAIRFPTAGLHRYEVRYRVRHPDAWAFRCPVWLPAVAADGRSRNVTIEVRLPPDATPAGGAFPDFAWAGGTGRATLGHLPAFVRVPYLAPGEGRPPGRDMDRIMDRVAVGLLVVGTAYWLSRRRRR